MGIMFPIEKGKLDFLKKSHCVQFVFETINKSLYMPNRSRVRSKKNIPRKFLSEEEKRQIIEYFATGLDIVAIAEKINHSKRQVKEFIKNHVHQAENNFTRDEDKKILEILQFGISSPSVIAKNLPGKTTWMVRNRIKFYLRRFNNLDDIDIDFFLDGIHRAKDEITEFNAWNPDDTYMMDETIPIDDYFFDL